VGNYEGCYDGQSESVMGSFLAVFDPDMALCHQTGVTSITSKGMGSDLP
jgi:hypothetical protein